MKYGRYICNNLKKIRLDIARANDIDYQPSPCNHTGDCDGTCPACESEVRYLERELSRRRSMGKAALIAGVSLSLASFSAFAGSNASNSSPKAPQKKSAKHKSKEMIRGRVASGTPHANYFGMAGETKPIFPGGEKALRDFIRENMKYPPEAVKDSIQGRVVVKFMVGRDGVVGDVKVEKGAHPALDSEAVRVIRLLPKFTPGTRDGKREAMWYLVPVQFKLPEAMPPEE